MTFAEPWWLIGLVAVPVLVGLHAWAVLQRRSAETLLVAARLRNRLLPADQGKNRWLLLALRVGAVAALLVAAARPQWGETREVVRVSGRDVLIAVDTSRSMLAADIKPSRLARAKIAVEYLMGRLKGDRVGLIAFSGAAFLQAPLTLDHGAVRLALKELNAGIIPVGGTSLEGAIRLARKAFEEAESAAAESRILILFTDGGDEEENPGKLLQDGGLKMTVFTVGAGTAEGALIPDRDEQGRTAFVRGQDRTYVKTRLDEARLAEVAKSSGGFYVGLESGTVAMDRIVNEGIEPSAARSQKEAVEVVRTERYHIPLIIGLLCAAASAALESMGRLRRAVAAVVGFAAVFGWLPGAAYARNTALEKYAAGDYKQALTEFEKQLAERPGNSALLMHVGNAAFRAGEYDRAARAFSEAATQGGEMGAQATFNLANTLAQRGSRAPEAAGKKKEWSAALEHYEDVLRRAPSFNAAAKNRDLVATALEELEKQEKEKKKEQGEGDSSKDQKDQKDEKGQKDQNDGKEQNDGKDEKDEKDGKEGEPKESEQQGSQNGGEKGKDESASSKQEGSESEQKSADAKKDERAKSGDEPGKEAPQSSADAAKPEAASDKENLGAAGADPSDKNETKGGALQPRNTNAEPGQEMSEAELEQLAAREGKMTEQQAKALLESLRSEVQRPLLFDAKEFRGQRPPRRDW